MSSRNVGNYQPTLCRISEERRSHVHHGGSLKSLKKIVRYTSCFLISSGLGQYNLYSLWAERSGDRIPVGVRISAPVQTGPGAHPAFCTMGTGSLSREQSGQGVALTTHPHLQPMLKKKYSYTSIPPLSLHGLFEGKFYFFSTFYSYFKLLQFFHSLSPQYIFIPPCQNVALFRTLFPSIRLQPCPYPLPV